MDCSEIYNSRNTDDTYKDITNYFVRLRKFRSVGKSGMWCGATLRYCGVGFLGPRRVLQSRGRTWLQLMCCASVLELGVLILEWSSGAAE